MSRIEETAPRARGEAKGTRKEGHDEMTPRNWLSLRLMEIFATVVQADSMTAAANRLGMTQSAVSQAIATIEAGLGAQLVNRSTRPIQLTLLGTKFYERATELLRRARELEQMMDLALNDRLPLLRIGMADSFASTAGPHLLRMLETVASRWSVVSGVQETSVKALLEQRVDVAITSEETAPESGLVTIPVLREPYFIVGPKDADLAIPIVELAARLPLIRYSAGAFLGRQIEAYLQRQGTLLPRQYEFDTSDAVLAMVKAGFGWTITTPLCVLKTHAALDDFQYLPLTPPGMTRTLNLIAHDGQHTPLWERIAETARTLLDTQWVPRIQKLAPWDALPGHRQAAGKGKRRRA